MRDGKAPVDCFGRGQRLFSQLAQKQRRILPAFGVVGVIFDAGQGDMGLFLTLPLVSL